MYNVPGQAKQHKLFNINALAVFNINNLGSINCSVGANDIIFINVYSVNNLRFNSFDFQCY